MRAALFSVLLCATGILFSIGCLHVSEPKLKSDRKLAEDNQHEPGGDFFASYYQSVIDIYKNAWAVPSDLNDDQAVVQVTVTIARSGKVLKSRIFKSSGLSSLDKSVQRTLGIVKFAKEFPEAAKESQLTFHISFRAVPKR